MKARALLLAAFVAAAQGAELTPLERDGRVIYLEGTSPSGARIGARIGQGGIDISNQVGACGNCHDDKITSFRLTYHGKVRPRSVRPRSPPAPRATARTTCGRPPIRCRR